MAAGLYAFRGVETAYEWTSPETRGYKCKSGMEKLISNYKPAPLLPLHNLIMLIVGDAVGTVLQNQPEMLIFKVISYSSLSVYCWEKLKTTTTHSFPSQLTPWLDPRDGFLSPSMLQLTLHSSSTWWPWPESRWHTGTWWLRHRLSCEGQRPAILTQKLDIFTTVVHVLDSVGIYYTVT